MLLIKEKKKIFFFSAKLKTNKINLYRILKLFLFVCLTPYLVNVAQ